MRRVSPGRHLLFGRSLSFGLPWALVFFVWKVGSGVASCPRGLKRVCFPEKDVFPTQKRVENEGALGLANVVPPHGLRTELLDQLRTVVDLQ